MSDELDILPTPQLNPANGKMEPGFKVKNAKGGELDGAVCFIVIGLAIIVGIVYAVVWVARKLIALYKSKQARLAPRPVQPLTLADHVAAVKRASTRTNVHIA